MGKLLHYTINSGEVVAHASPGQAEIAKLEPLVSMRRGPIPNRPGFKLTIFTGVVLLIEISGRRNEVVSTGALAWDEASEARAWPTVEQAYFEISDRNPSTMRSVPVRPEELPWLAVMRMCGMENYTDHEMTWLTPFEVCLAWALLQSELSNSLTS